ncbi:disease resistance RPP13-like protein 4 isoform X2 [Carex rostrata]
MSNNKKGAKLKAGIAEFVGPLLKRLELVKEQVPKDLKTQEIINQIRIEVLKTKCDLDIRENCDTELTGCFAKIERQIDYWVDENDRTTELNERFITNLKVILNQLARNQRKNRKTTFEVGESSKNASDLPQKERITKASASSNWSYEENIVSMTLKCIEPLDPQMVRCLYSLGIFPENTELKKRLVIYWWIALGLLPFKGDTRRTIEQGEFFFSYLVDKDVLTTVNVREHNQVTDSCIISPTIHKQLIFACEGDGRIISEQDGTWHLYKDNIFHMDVLLNLSQRYLNYKDINGTNKKYDLNLKVIQLGSWRYTETEIHNVVGKTGSEETKSKDHIEIDDTQFLKELPEKVTYLSLRGISGIEELPESIRKLENLKILDLRACHNLEKLPQKSRSTFKQKLIRSALHQESWFKNMVVLDTSECYLLDHMPKWICELSNLEVLKGFVVGNVGNKNQSCQLSDLSKLKNLWKLSIRILIEHSGTEDFSGLKPLNNILVLTIIWGGNKDNNKGTVTYSLPKYLEKLDIRCYPKTEASELLNPAELKNLKRLYIRGGKLTKIRNDARWEVEILRLKFLKNLKTNWVELRRSFGNLKYVEYVECPELENFPEGRSHWIKEKDEPNHKGNTSETSNQS